MEVSFGAPTAGAATGAGLVAQVGGQQRLPPQEGGQELGHLGVDGLEALAELGQAWLYHIPIYITKLPRCQALFSPIG